MLPDPYNCTHAQMMAEDPFIKAGAIFQVFIACLTMLPFLFMLKHRPKSFRRISNLASTNLKVVFFAGIIFVLVHSIGIVLFKTFSMVRALMAEDECDFRWSTLQCLCFKIPIYWTVFGFSCLHLALFFDRFLATFCGNFYTNYGHLPGILMLIGTFGLATTIVYLIYRNENVQIPRAYCNSTSADTTLILSDYMRWTTIVDLFISVGDFGLWVVNRIQLKRKATNYSLQQSLKLKENNISIQLIFPLSVVHSVCFSTVFLLILMNRQRFPNITPAEHILSLEVNHSCISLYVLIVVCNVCFLLKKIDADLKGALTQSSIRPADAYFKQLEKTFEMPRRKLATANIFQKVNHRPLA